MANVAISITGIGFIILPLCKHISHNSKLRELFKCWF